MEKNKIQSCNVPFRHGQKKIARYDDNRGGCAA